MIDFEDWAKIQLEPLVEIKTPEGRERWLDWKICYESAPKEDGCYWVYTPWMDWHIVHFECDDVWPTIRPLCGYESLRWPLHVSIWLPIKEPTPVEEKALRRKLEVKLKIALENDANN